MKILDLQYYPSRGITLATLTGVWTHVQFALITDPVSLARWAMVAGVQGASS